MLDIGFVEVPTNEQFAERIWSELDEQTLAPETRRQLTNNGLRVGLVTGRFPQPLRERLDGRHASASGDSDSKASLVDQTLDHGQNSRRLQLRRGKRGEIVTADIRKKLVLLCHETGHFCGDTFNDAQTVFIVEGHGNNDGSATIELVPEIQHGQPQSRFVGREGAFCLEASRDRRVFKDLLVASNLSPGQTLVIGAFGPEKTVGSSFFRQADGQSDGEKLLLIRLACSPGDELFSTNEQDPIVEHSSIENR